MKTRTTITIDPDLLERATKANINISARTEEALIRELESYEKTNYAKALDVQNGYFKKFLLEKELLEEFNNCKYSIK
jgi:hypothetical protein